MKPSVPSISSAEKSKEKSVDSSDYDSDAGASPSFSDSDTSSVSSRSSSPGALRIVETSFVTPKKRSGNDGGSTAATPARTSKRKNNVPSASKNKQSGTSGVDVAPCIPSTSKGLSNLKTLSNNGTGSGITNSSKKRKRPIDKISSARRSGSKSLQLPFRSASKRPCLNQRRRTKSERNTRAGKVVPVPVEESVALDAEIDKFLEEKAMKNNLTATNVKSIIRHVITNNMVQKMIMSTVKKKGTNPDDSSDDEAFYEPKLTRARTKLLLGDHTSTPLWPSLSVSSPAKSKSKPISETHFLIHDEFPEDSSGDEEYVPREDETHSDDESSSVASHTSEKGSPCPVPSTSKRAVIPGSRTRQGNKEESSKSASNTNTEEKPSPIFKTPTPVRPKCVRKLDNGISKRTRSKLPLNDTPLEDLEMQLIPPDITTDMYDWGLSDNEDYLAFVKDFLCPGQNAGENNEAGDDDEAADPEYNVMEEEEEHDKEELRMDRAVKVSKKELNELVAELLEESHFTSGDELDDTEFASFCASQLSHMTGNSVHEANLSLPVVCNSNQQSTPQIATSSSTSVDKKLVLPISFPDPSSQLNSIPVVAKAQEKSTQNPERSLAGVPTQPSIIISKPLGCPPVSTAPMAVSLTALPSGRITITNNTITPVLPVAVRLPTVTSNEVVLETLPHTELGCNTLLVLEAEPQFSTGAIAILKHQIRQHVQLLAQSYVLTGTVDDPYFKNISFNSKRMINEMRSLLVLNGPQSVFSGGNVEDAWNLVNSWPPNTSKSPIKKKILEEKYINDCQQDIHVSSTSGNDTFSPNEHSKFPRPVVKVIAESPAFTYPELLPQRYNQRATTALNFTLSEDMLIVCGYEDSREHKLTTHVVADAIRTNLLPARTTTSVFHRIKNLRRKSKTANCHPAVKEYFQLGKIPPGTSVPDYWDQSHLQAPIAQPHELLSPTWQKLVTRLAEYSQYSWTGKPKHLDSKSPSKAPGSKNSPNNSEIIPALSQSSLHKSSPSKPNERRESHVILTVFPVGSTMSRKLNDDNQDVETFPIRDCNGNPGVWVSVPKWLPGKTDPIVDGLSSSSNEKSSQGRRLFLHESPSKLAWDNRQISQKSENTGSQGVDEEQSVSVTRVGNPFDLPSEIQIQESDVIDLASLATPLKRAILESAEGLNAVLDVSGVDSGLSFCTDDPETSYRLEIETTRDQHSARTFGGTRESLNESKLCGYNDFEDDSSSEKSESEESNVHEDEDSSDFEGSHNEAIEEVVISSDEETPMPVGQEKTDVACDSGDSNKKSDNQPAASSDQNAATGNGNGTSEGTSDNSSSVSITTGKRQRRENEDDEDGDKKNNRHNLRDCSPHGQGANESAEPEETEEEETEPKEQKSTHPKRQVCQGKSKGKKRKSNQVKDKSKKSPSSSNVNTAGGKKRSMKSSKCTPVEKMLEEDPILDEDVTDAFLESFLHRLLAASEKKHPSLNNEFVKLLCEAEQCPGNPDGELLAKMKILLKDYPDLLTEFTTYVESDENYVPVKEDEHFQEKQQNDAYVNFLRHLEKFTERNPQLKAKILHKLKVFSESSNPSQRDIAESLEPFFQGNEVMMRAFKAILPSVYRPDSINNKLDFEIVDMESEEFSSQDDHSVESVTLPEEKAIPATNTCPCVCHDAATATHVYSVRAKHCHKCCLKFQDGKVFVHNGRVTKQVNVEMTTASDAKKKSIGNSCKSCVQDSTSATVKFKETLVTPSSSKLKDEAEFKRPKAHAPHQTSFSQVPASSVSCTITSSSGQEAITDIAAISSILATNENVDSEDRTRRTDRKTWSLEEDHMILTAIKSVSEADLDEAFGKLTSDLPNRDRTEIESRCVELISLLQSEFGSVDDEAEMINE